MKVLFVGDAWLGSNARSLADGFRNAGHEVVQVDTTALNKPVRYSVRWGYSKIAKQRFPADRERVHRAVESAVAEWHPDVVVGFKTIHLDQARLLASLSGTARVHYSADDVSNSENTTVDYLAHEREWDLIVTTKRHNMPELVSRGVHDPLFVYSAFDPTLHFAAARTSSRKSVAGFVGNYRPDRASLMTALGDELGDELAVFGPGWSRATSLQKTGAIVRAGVYGPDFSRAVAGIGANLVLLNSENRDTHTCRSFEVPAAAGLFVGERTDEHQELIEDGASGFLFSDMPELLDILRRVSRDTERCRSIAEKGHRSVLDGGHTYMDRARTIIERISAR